MEKTRQARFKKLFEEQKNNLLYSGNAVGLLDETFLVQKEAAWDEADWSSAEVENEMKLRLRNREALLIKKMDAALRRIQDGTFGVCESCEGEIEEKRLIVRPTTTLCLECKEAQEVTELQHIDGHRHKSIG